VQNDPGALIGTAGAFAEPGSAFSVYQESAIFPPALEWRELLTRDSEKSVARGLIAHLYQARITPIQVIWAVPTEEFVGGAPLHKLVAFARAALPWELKQDSRIRIYTSLPATFLQDLKADLIVIPESLARDALRVCPEAALLDRSGKSHGGGTTREFAACERYADTILDRFLDSPAGTMAPALLPFTGEIVARVLSDYHRVPSADVLDTIANLYDLIAVSGTPEEAGKLLLYLYRQAERNARFVQPWEKMIPQGFLEAVSDLDLQKIIRSRPLTGDGQALRDVVRNSERAKQLSIPLPDDATAGEIFEYYESKFASRQDVVDALLRLNVEEIYKLLAPESSRARLLLELTKDRPLPQEWITGLPLQGNSAEVARRLLVCPENAIGDGARQWRMLLRTSLRNVLHENASSPELVEALMHLPPPAEIEDCFLRAEIIHRALPERGEPLLQSALQAPLGPEQRRWIFTQWCDAAFTCLNKLEVPVDWDPVLRDLWLQAPEEKLVRAVSARLLNLVEDSQPLPPNLLRAIDKHLDAEMESLSNALKGQERQAAAYMNKALHTTAALTVHDRWLAWRVNSALPPKRLRWCAMAWLLHKQGALAKLEEWKQVVLDLRILDPGEIPAMERQCSSNRFDLPRMPLFENVQLDDLVRLANRNWPVLVEVARIGYSRYSADEVQRRAGISMPEGVLSSLVQGTRLPQAMTGSQLQTLYQAAKDYVSADIMQQAVLQLLVFNAQEAVALAGQFNLWVEDKFRWGVFIHLHQKTLSESSLQVLDPILRNKLLPQRANIPDAQYRQLEDYYRSRNFPNVAAWVGLRASLRPLASASKDVALVCEQVLQGLLRGEVSDSYWQELMRLCESQQNPLANMVANLRQLGPSAHKELDRSGWQAFHRACSNPEYKALLADYGNRVPALEIAALLRDSDPIGEVAARIIQCRRWPDDCSTLDWWRALLATIANCRRRSQSYGSQDRVDAAFLRVLNTTTDLANREGWPWVRRDIQRALEERIYPAVRLESPRDQKLP
jgi:hypothetical protein